MARLAEYVLEGYSLLFFLIVLDSMLHSKLKTPRSFISFIGW